MAEKRLNTRIVHKHETEANWLLSSLVPMQGEIIVYDKDENYNYERIKIGDGSTSVNALPFIDANTLSGASLATSLMYPSDTRIPTTKAVSNSLNTLRREVVNADWATNDNSKHRYIKNRTHWIEYEQGEELVSFTCTTDTSYYNGYRATLFTEETESALNLLKTSLVEGKVYIVIHNSARYECVVYSGFMSYDKNIIGNMWLNGSAEEDTEEQFVIRPYETGTYRFLSQGAGQQSVAIYEANEVVHPLDEKFIPETVVRIADLDGIATESYVDDKITEFVGDISVSEQINTAISGITAITNEEIDEICTDFIIDNSRAVLDEIDEIIGG